MNLVNIIFLALALALDAFSVTVASGAVVKNEVSITALKMALYFGAFQTIMPLLGWLAGAGLARYIAGVDHWLAFGLLVFVGAKMIWESFFLGPDEKKFSVLDVRALLLLAVATSLDALAVGFSLSLLGVSLIIPSVIIGLVTFGLCWIGFYIGRNIGHLFENNIEVVGGLILIGIGIKILLEHL